MAGLETRLPGSWTIGFDVSHKRVLLKIFGRAARISTGESSDSPGGEDQAGVNKLSFPLASAVASHGRYAEY